MSFASVFSRFRPALLLGAVAFLPLTLLQAQTPGSFDSSFLSPLSASTVFAIANEYVETSSGPLEYIAQGGDQDGLYITYGSGLTVSSYAYPFFGSDQRIVYTIVPEAVLDPTTNTYKLLLGGSFGKTQVVNDFVPTGNVERLDLETGAIDTTFNGVGVGADDFVTSILPLSDGSMLVGGLFTHFNMLSYPRLVHLGPTGYVDTSFQPVNFTDGVFALAPESDPATGAFDGKVLVGGDFSTIGSANYTKLVRVDLAGNVDTTFRPTIDSRVLAIATQPDGKIVIGGEFSLVNGQTVGHIARLNQDGSLDTTFQASIGVLPANTSAPVAVYVLKLLPDGRIYVGGQFSAVDGVTRNYLGLINPDGSLDASFDPGTVILNSVQALALQTDGRILVGETLSKKVDNGTVPPSIIRLYGAIPAVNLTVGQSQAVVGKVVERKTGIFTFKRSGGDINTSLTVAFQLGGTAPTQSGKSFALAHASLKSGNVYTATFAPGQTRYKVRVRTSKHLLPESPETVTLTLLPAQGYTSNYETGTSTTATVFISNP